MPEATVSGVFAWTQGTIAGLGELPSPNPMTHSILIVSAAVLLVAKPAPSKTTSPTKTTHTAKPNVKKGHALPQAKPTHAPAAKKKPPAKKLRPGKFDKKGPKRGKAARKLHAEHLPPNAKVPGFQPLVVNQVVVRLQEQRNVTPPIQTQEASNDPRVVATLGAARPRDGGATIDFRCAFVHTYAAAGEMGLAMFPHRLIDFCRDQNPSYEPGVTVSFPVTAGKFYTVECDSAASTEFRMRHKMLGESSWSSVAQIRTRAPLDFIRPTRAGTAMVQISFDPADNHILTQSIRECRVSEIG